MNANAVITGIRAVFGSQGFGHSLVSGAVNLGKHFYNGMTNSSINSIGNLLYGGTSQVARDAFIKAGGFGGLAAGALIKIPLALSVASSVLDDTRRIRETAGGQSGFYVSREAEHHTWLLSAAATAACVPSLFRLRNLAESKWLDKAGNLLPKIPALKGLTTLTSVTALGLFAARSIYKWWNIDLPFNDSAGIAALSFNGPVMRVRDPSSPYYGYSHLLEKSAQRRIEEDMEHGEAGEGAHIALERMAIGFGDFMMGSHKHNSYGHA